MGAVMSRFDTLILRFRDFSELSTIEEHKRIIEENGYVYWGWWAKPQETVPLKDIMEFRKSLESSTKNIILFDSGNQKLYTATCSGIYVNNGELCSVEESSSIPEYYRNTNCRMWFKLDYISNELRKDEYNNLLNQYSYVCIERWLN